MIPRLRTLLADAEALPEPDQDILADMIEDFMAAPEDDALLTPEELAELDRIAAEPFVAADPQEVAALFAKYGQG